MGVEGYDPIHHPKWPMAEDMQEAQEHIKALENAIAWCHDHRAEISFATDLVYIKVYMNRVMQMRGASTFLQAVEIFMEP